MSHRLSSECECQSDCSVDVVSHLQLHSVSNASVTVSLRMSGIGRHPTHSITELLIELVSMSG